MYDSISEKVPLSTRSPPRRRELRAAPVSRLLPRPRHLSSLPRRVVGRPSAPRMESKVRGPRRRNRVAVTTRSAALLCREAEARNERTRISGRARRRGRRVSSRRNKNVASSGGGYKFIISRVSWKLHSRAIRFFPAGGKNARREKIARLLRQAGARSVFLFRSRHDVDYIICMTT